MNNKDEAPRKVHVLGKRRGTEIGEALGCICTPGDIKVFWNLSEVAVNV